MAEAKVTMLLDTLREINSLVLTGVMDKESAQLACKFVIKTLVPTDHTVIDLRQDEAVSDSDLSDNEPLDKTKTSKRKAESQDVSDKNKEPTKKRGPGRPPKKSLTKITTTHVENS